MGSDHSKLFAHRLTSGRVVAYVLLAGFGLTLAGVAGRAGVPGRWGTIAALLAGSALVYVLGLRPALVEAPAGLEVRNPLRTTKVPWDALSSIDVVDVLRLHTADGTVRCFAVPRRRPSPGLRPPSAASYNFGLPSDEPGGGWQPPRGLPRAEALAQRLRDLQEEYRGVGSGPAVTHWAADALGALALAVALALVALALL